MFNFILKKSRDFSGGPVVKTSPSNAGGAGSIPGQGAKIPHVLQPKNQSIKQKQCCNKFNKDFKNGPHQKKKKLKKKLKKNQVVFQGGCTICTFTTDAEHVRCSIL